MVDIVSAAFAELNADFTARVGEFHRSVRCGLGIDLGSNLFVQGQRHARLAEQTRYNFIAGRGRGCSGSVRYPGPTRGLGEVGAGKQIDDVHSQPRDVIHLVLPAPSRRLLRQRHGRFGRVLYGIAHSGRVHAASSHDNTRCGDVEARSFGHIDVPR
jgi:hypothetical protein